MSPTEQLAAYLPIDRVLALARGQSLEARAEGAVLFADVSGFTALTESLEQQLGPRRGGEELTARLNQVYAPLIHEVHQHGGSVIGFSGDAITCWFPADDGHRATACGLRLLRVMESGTVPGLAIKVGIAAGPVHRFAVGDPSVQLLDVACGATLDRMAAAERGAERSQLVVSAEVRAALGQDAVIEGGAVRALSPAEALKPWPPLDAAALSVEQLRPWLLPPIYDTLIDGHTGFLADLRPAAALFLGFSGLDFDGDGGAAERLDAFVRWTQQVLRRYAGYLIQLTTGDKGGYLYAAFGAPVALEDPIGRALAAAQVLRRPESSLWPGPLPRIGVSFGRMRAGAYGSERRRTYGVIGDDTNVAARLMSLAAPGQVLASARIAQAGAGRYTFAPLGATSVKGKKAPLELFDMQEPLAASPSLQTGTATVGRERERGLLFDALEALGRGESRVALLQGEPGIGKSTLVGELVSRARSLSIPAYVASGDAIETGTPLHAWRGVFTALFGLEGLSDPAQIEARVRERLPLLGPYATLLSPVLPAALPSTPQVLALPVELRVRRMLALLAQAFAVLTRDAPTLLVVEDAHWLDSLSWQLLETLRRQSGALLVVATARLQGGGDALEKLKQQAGPLHLRLLPLSADDVAALVARRLEVDALPDSVSALVRAKAEGNPFFAVELAFALRDAGVLEISDGQARVLQPLAGITFPDSVEGVVTSRIDRLKPAQQLMVKVASVLGRAFPEEPLQALLPAAGARTDLEQLLTQVERLELIEAHRPEQRWVFSHAITHEVAYNLMLFEQRRALHHAAADWYEARGGAESAPLLAHHRLKSLEGLTTPELARVQKAVAAVLAAGRQAMQAGAAVEGLRWAQGARGLVEALAASREKSELELEVCTVIGAALAVVRGPAHGDVQAEFQRARELCRALGQTSRLFEAVFGQWYASLTGCDRAGALEFSAQLLEVAQSQNDPAMRTVAEQARGATLISDGQHAKGLEHVDAGAAAQKALAQQNSAGPASAGPASAGTLAAARNTVVMSHCYRAWAHWFLGLPDLAATDATQAIAQARASSSPLVLVQALCFAGLVHRFRREPDVAAPLVREAARLAAEHGIIYWVSVTEGLDAWMHLERGEAAEAVALLERVRQRERESELVHLGTSTTLSDLLRGYIALGRYGDADETMATARQLHQTRLLGFGFPELLRLDGESWARRKDLARARRSLDAALELARTQQARSLELRALVSLSQLDPSAVTQIAALVDCISGGRSTPDLKEAAALLGREAAIP
jgi:class 3 adenylate cyclase/tetratricopeptide (TPR) repeat protein